MDWDDLCSTSELSSSEACSSDGREADDEQSDWVAVDESVASTGVIQAVPLRQSRAARTRTAAALLQRKLERFIRDDTQRELVVRHWTRSRQINRVLQYVGLEVSKRSRGTVVLKKTR